MAQDMCVKGSLAMSKPDRRAKPPKIYGPNVDERIGRAARAIDRSIHAAMASRTGGLSPIALSEVWWDWAAHLATSPGRQLELAMSAGAKALTVASSALDPDIDLDDVRYRDPAWKAWPYRLMAATHKAQEDSVGRGDHGFARRVAKT